MPQSAEGMRIEPPVSSTATAEFQLEPPGVLCVSQGFSVRPKVGMVRRRTVGKFSQVLSSARPKTLHDREFTLGTKSFRILEPAVVEMWAVGM
jgi:hypothetical protein